MKRLIALFFIASCPAIAAPYMVTTEAELRTAARAASTQPAATIMLDRPITLNSPLTIYGDSVAIIGVGAAEIRFANPADCSHWWMSPQNGIELCSPVAIVRGVKISPFEWQGSAIKWNCDSWTGRLLSVTRCTFNGVKMNWCPPTTQPVRDASDTFYGACVAGHHFANATIDVSGNTFNRSCLGQQDYDHCVYVSAKQIIVCDNTFNNCGCPFDLEGKGLEASVVCAGNVVTAGKQQYDKTGRRRWPNLFVFGHGDHTVVAGNRLTGTFDNPFTGYPFSSPATVIGWNDWTGATFIEPFAADLWTAKYISATDWRRIETGSVWP